MPSSMKHLTLIVTVGAVIFFTNLGVPRLWDRDEPRNAGCAAEMIERGDWVVPYFNGEIRGHKPVLTYWFMIASYKIFGTTEFAARFFSALLGLGTAVMTYLMGRRLFHPQVGLWAGIILVSTLMFDVASRAATPDAYLIFFTTGSMCLFVYAAFGRKESKHETKPLSSTQHTTEKSTALAHVSYPTWLMSILIYIPMGIAVLGKGPIGFVMPTGVIGLFWLFHTWFKRQSLKSDSVLLRKNQTVVQRMIQYLQPFHPRNIAINGWKMRPITLVVVVLAVALPWYIWVDIRTGGSLAQRGEWTRQFFIEHNLNRATTSMESHSGPIYYYIIAVMVGFFPWSIFLGPMFLNMYRRIKKRHAWSWGYLLVTCWIAMWIISFSIAKTKLPSYVTPCYPALALLTAALVYHWYHNELTISTRWLYASFSCLAIAGIGIMVGIPIASSYYFPGEMILGAVGLVPLVAAGLGMWWLRKGDHRKSVLAMTTLAPVFTIVFFCFAQVRLDRHQNSEQLIGVIQQNTIQRPAIASYAGLEPSWVYYAGQSITEYDIKDRQGLIHFITQHEEPFVITQLNHYNQIKNQLPEEMVPLKEVPRFLKGKSRLVVLGIKRTPQRVAQINDRKKRKIH